MRGKFFTFEGGEGAGKSTQIDLVADVLRERGFNVVVTREPGGSPGAEAIRHVLLSGAAEPFGTEMEAVLFAAARSDHVEQVIKPALIAGTTVLCDRFMDSSRVYQGASGNVPKDVLDTLERATTEGAQPDLTLIFDLPPEIGLQRATLRRGKAKADRYEKETMKLQKIRRKAFLDIAKSEPERCVVINADQKRQVVHSDILTAIDGRLDGLKTKTKKTSARAKPARKKPK